MVSKVARSVMLRLVKVPVAMTVRTQSRRVRRREMRRVRGYWRVGGGIRWLTSSGKVSC